MSAKEVKDDRKYTKDHEWAKEQDGLIVVGITAFAVDQLGDITLVGLDVKEGDAVEEGKPFGTIESVKTLSDLFAPVSGTVKAINPALEAEPELINEDCWGKGWMISIAPNEPGDLMDSQAYRSLLEASDH
ncbi:MAG TPA: glycine cleavage system protein GcvH [Polyangiaceae bacterium]